MTAKNSVVAFIVSILILFSFNPHVFAATSIVNPNQVYTYEVLTSNIQKLAQTYPDLMTYKSIGKTPYGRQQWAVKVGHGPAVVFVNGSHHAREWLTTTLVMKQLETYLQAYKAKTSVDGYNMDELFNRVTIWFVPMVNPDGVTLQQKGLKAFPRSDWNKIIKMNNGRKTFIDWKATAQGIDLNRQYPANWNGIVNPGSAPSFMNYKGKAPLIAPEAKHMADFAKEIKPDFAISYHSSGEIMFWHFHNKLENMIRDLSIVRMATAITGYEIIKPRPNPSGGGFTDWFIQQFGKPGLTPEIGVVTGPRSLSLSAFPRAWSQNKTLPLFAATKAFEICFNAQTAKPVNEHQQLFERVSFYDKPTNLKASGNLDPQDVLILEKKGEWLKVQSKVGIKWILPRQNQIAKITKINIKLGLTQKTILLDTPFMKPGSRTLNPQVITGKAKYNNYYLIAIDGGNKWIKSDGVVENPVIPKENPEPSENPVDTGTTPPPSEQPVDTGVSPQPSEIPVDTGGTTPPSATPVDAGTTPPPSATPVDAGGTTPPSGTPTTN